MQPQENQTTSENKFAVAFYANPAATFIIAEPEGHFLDVNRAFEKLSGYSSKEVLGKTSVELGFITMEEHLRLNGIMHARGMMRNVETYMHTASGENLLLRISAERVQIDGQLCFLLVAENITEEHRVRDALKESENIFSKIFHLSPEMGIITRRGDGRIIAVNDAFLNVSGFDREELVGKSTEALQIWGNGERRAFLDHLEKMGTVRDAEVLLQKKSGERYPVMYSAVVLDFRGEPCIFAFGTEILERKKAEEERKRFEALLRQNQRMEAIGTLAGGVAHDFNNILAAIIGYSELVKLSIPERESASLYIDQILNASLRAKDLVQQILTFSRMKPSKDLRPLRMSPLVKETVKFLRASIPSTIEIRQEICCLPDMVLADPAQIRQVLVNLAANATRAMEDKGGVMGVRLANVELGVDCAAIHPDLSPGKYLVLSVSDTGHGISPDLLDRIFEPYFTTKSNKSGTGFGLAAVHGIARRHNAAVTVQSEQGRGTTFSVYFPQAEDSADVVGVQGQNIPCGTESVLLIDDEQPVADFMSAMLQGLGYRVTAKTNPVEALSGFWEDPLQFDVVITDYTMPGLTGIDVAMRMRELRADIPIVIATGFSDRMDGETAKKLGLDAFLMKPSRRAEIANVVRKVLDGRKN